MRKALFLVVCLGSFLPGVVHAATCSAKGYTIIYVNGILASSTSARDSTDAIRNKLGSSFGGEIVTVKPAQNPSELWGVDDALKTLRQMQFWDDGTFHEDADVDTILDEIYSELTTQKVLLVGHSQGTFYTNDIYYYLTTHGMLPDAVGVYNIATPADRVAGGGNYLTSFNDSVIKALKKSVIETPYIAGVKPPLSPNFIAEPPPEDSSGHFFVPSYLNTEPDTVVGDMQQALSKLKPTYDFDVKERCFDLPDRSFKDKAAVFVGDHALSTVEGTYIAGVGFVIGAGDLIARAAGAVQKVALDIGTAIGGIIGISHAAEPAKATTNFNVVESLYGSRADAKELQDLLGRDQGSAAILAFSQDEPASTSGEVLGSSTPQSAADSTAGQAATTTPILFPTAPEAMPGEVVHYNAPAFGGLVAAEDSQADPPPDPVPDVTLTPPVITFSNWRASDNVFFCSGLLRYVDVSWSAVPGATYYEIRSDDATPTSYNELSTTTGTTWPGLVLATTNDRIDPITVTVTAYDAAGNSATSTTRVDQALADQTPPQLLFESLSPQLFATGTPVTTAIKIPFSEPLATSTVIHNAFALGRVGDVFQTEMNVSISADGTAAIITPLQPLQYSSGYGVSVDCTISDIYGNRLPNQIGVGSQNSPYFTTEVQ